MGPGKGSHQPLVPRNIDQRIGIRGVLGKSSRNGLAQRPFPDRVPRLEVPRNGPLVPRSRFPALLPDLLLMLRHDVLPLLMRPERHCCHMHRLTDRSAPAREPMPSPCPVVRWGSITREVMEEGARHVPAMQVSDDLRRRHGSRRAKQGATGQRGQAFKSASGASEPSAPKQLQPEAAPPASSRDLRHLGRLRGIPSNNGPRYARNPSSVGSSGVQASIVLHLKCPNRRYLQRVPTAIPRDTRRGIPTDTSDADKVIRRYLMPAPKSVYNSHRGNAVHHVDHLFLNAHLN